MLEQHVDDGGADVGPSMGASLLVGCAIGVAVSIVGITAMALALGVEWASAVGLGLFIACWGGLGFGAMVGGVVHADRLERRAHADRASHRG